MFEPVLERSRADARISAGGERLIVHRYAEVARLTIGDHLPRVAPGLERGPMHRVTLDRIDVRSVRAAAAEPAAW